MTTTPLLTFWHIATKYNNNHKIQRTLQNLHAAGKLDFPLICTKHIAQSSASMHVI